MLAAALIFLITTIICAVGWLTRYISAAALWWYLDKKNVPAPSDEDMKQGCDWAVRHMVRDLAFWRGKGA